MILRAENISKYFYQAQRQKVLENVSLNIDVAELVSIFGESGSGKSTLLYILATLDIDFEGKLWIQDHNVKDMTEDDLAALRNRQLGFVYQFHYLLPEFNVLQNVMLPAYKLGLKGKNEIEADAVDLLDDLGMASYALRPAYKLSGGQQQRVAIARALINNPDLIIADEPTGNLDQKNSQLIFDLLKEIVETRGKSVVLATHNSKIMKNSHRSVEIIDGSLRL